MGAAYKFQALIFGHRIEINPHGSKLAPLNWPVGQILMPGNLYALIAVGLFADQLTRPQNNVRADDLLHDI